MPKFSYVAMDSRGKETKGTLEVANQNEAIARPQGDGLLPHQGGRGREGQGEGRQEGQEDRAGRQGKKKAKKGINFNKIPFLGGEGEDRR